MGSGSIFSTVYEEAMLCNDASEAHDSEYPCSTLVANVVSVGQVEVRSRFDHLIGANTLLHF